MRGSVVKPICKGHRAWPGAGARAEPGVGLANHRAEPRAERDEGAGLGARMDVDEDEGRKKGAKGHSWEVPLPHLAYSK